MKLNLMTFEFNVDIFYAQLGTFSIFTISHIREMKPGSNWIPWPMNLMLTDFMPNWTLFLFFVHLHDRGMKPGSNWISWPVNLMLIVISHERGVKPGSNWISCSVNLMLTEFRPNWAFFLFSGEGSKVKIGQIFKHCQMAKLPKLP